MSVRKSGDRASPQDPISAWRLPLAEFVRRAERLAILGIGERGKGDDGVGSRLAQRLSRSIGCRAGDSLLILDGGAMPENQTGVIRRFSPSHLLIVDAAHKGRAGGDIFVVGLGEVEEEELSSHRLPLTLLVRYLRSALSCQLLLLGIQPLLLEEGRLSAPVNRSLNLLLDLLKKELTIAAR